MIGVALTAALFALFWTLRDKLNTMGLEYVHWRRTSPVWIVRAVAIGVVAAAVTGWSFRSYDMGTQPPLAALWLQPSTTPDASGLNRRFRIIRPFHPWSGQDFELVTYLHTWGEHRVYFHKEGEHLVPVPATWTDILAEDPVVQLAAGRSLFRAMDLLELAELLEGLRGRHVKEITP